MSTRSTLVVTLSALLAACDCGGVGRPDAGAADADVDATLDATPDAIADAGTLPDAATSQDGGCQPLPPCEATDVDGDGAGAAPCGGDCNDSDPEIRPGLADPAGDGIDSNCDGADGEDLDGDGFLALASGGDDCDDADATIHPLANDNQGWFVETVGAAGDPRPQGAIALVLDAAGLDHLFFARGWPAEDPNECDMFGASWTYEFVHAAPAGGTWRFDSLTTGCHGDSGYAYFHADSAAAVGPDRIVQAVYCSVTERGSVEHFKLAHRAWTTEIVGEQGWGDDVADCAMAVDSCGEPQIAVGTDSEGIWRATPSLGTWSAIEVGGGFSPSIAIDDLDRTSIAFVEPANLEWTEWRAALAACCGRTWAVDRSIRDPLAHLGGVALTFGNTPLVAIRGGGGLEVASLGGEWTTELVDAAARGDESDWRKDFLAIASGGQPMIAYTVVGDGAYDVRLARKVDHAWRVEVLGTTCSQSVALALDSAGAPHIAFIGCGETPMPTVGTLREGTDGIDQNCDGVDGVDADHDGRASVATGGDDPDDGDPAR